MDKNIIGTPLQATTTKQKMELLKQYLIFDWLSHQPSRVKYK